MRGNAKQDRRHDVDIVDAMPSNEEVRPKKTQSRFRVLWIIADYLFDTAIEMLQGNATVVRREIQLFLGSALIIVGFFGFESGKYCDGNTADYLSCTRPSTYYYYDYIDLTCLILGVTLVLLWNLKRRS
jgi:hypothetical protein